MKTTLTEFDYESIDFADRVWSPGLSEGAGDTVATQGSSYARLPMSPKALRCPACGSIVYSRRHRLCGACSQLLPEEFLFTVEESHRIESLMSAERQRHRAWLSNTVRSWR